MAESEVLRGVCQELEESVFTLRMAVPYTWQGPAATALAEEVEAVAVDLARITSELHGAVAMLQWREQHLRTLATALGWSG